MDIQSLMRQAQAMQKKMQKTQEELANKSYEGAAGGGMVEVVVNGVKVVKKINIDPSLLNVEEKDILEDLIIAAVNNANNKAEEDSENSLKSLAPNGIQLPPGFKI